MSFFPEFLYKIRPEDAGRQPLEVIWRDGSASAALVTLGFTLYTVPENGMLLLKNMTGMADSAAASNVSRVRFFAQPPAGPRFSFFDSHEATAAGARVARTWVGEVLVLPGWSVRMEGEFTSGAAPNDVEAEMFGVLIPRGNFA